MQLDELKLEELALRNHSLNKKAIYILVNKDLSGYLAAQWDELEEEYRLRDYYSLLISINKPVDKNKTIQSNNQYTVFVKDFDKLTEERLTLYYAALECENECATYKQWVLDHIPEFKEQYKNTLVKIFFPATLEEYQAAGKKYVDKNIFANMKRVKILENGTQMGSPLTITINDKKPYEASLTRKNPFYVVTKEDAYKIKFLLDLFKGLIGRKCDKVYITNGEVIPVEYGTIVNMDIINATYYHFFMNDKGKVIIDDYMQIGRYGNKDTPKKTYFYYRTINDLFFEGKMYGLLIAFEQKNMKCNNFSEKHRIKDLLKSWFLHGCTPNGNKLIIITKTLIQITKNLLGDNLDVDIKRIRFIKSMKEDFEI